jgi:hypothetical protein
MFELIPSHDLNWNPHIHALIACAVFHPDGSMAPVALLQANIIQELFEANVLNPPACRSVND